MYFILTFLCTYIYKHFIYDHISNFQGRFMAWAENLIVLSKEYRMRGTNVRERDNKKKEKKDRLHVWIFKSLSPHTWVAVKLPNVETLFQQILFATENKYRGNSFLKMFKNYIYKTVWYFDKINIFNFFHIYIDFFYDFLLLIYAQNGLRNMHPEWNITIIALQVKVLFTFLGFISNSAAVWHTGYLI